MDMWEMEEVCHPNPVRLPDQKKVNTVKTIGKRGIYMAVKMTPELANKIAKKAEELAKRDGLKMRPKSK